MPRVATIHRAAAPRGASVGVRFAECVRGVAPTVLVSSEDRLTPVKSGAVTAVWKYPWLAPLGDFLGVPTLRMKCTGHRSRRIDGQATIRELEGLAEGRSSRKSPTAKKKKKGGGGGGKKKRPRSKVPIHARLVCETRPGEA